MKENIVYVAIRFSLQTVVIRYFVVRDAASTITENGIKNQHALHADVLIVNIMERIKVKEDREVANCRLIFRRKMQMNELKQCPFCGGAAEIFTTDEVGYLGVDKYTVRCGACMCGTGHYADATRARESWNRRVTVDQN